MVNDQNDPPNTEASAQSVGIDGKLAPDWSSPAFENLKREFPDRVVIVHSKTPRPEHLQT